MCYPVIRTLVQSRCCPAVGAMMKMGGRRRLLLRRRRGDGQMRMRVDGGRRGDGRREPGPAHGSSARCTLPRLLVLVLPAMVDAADAGDAAH